MTSLASMAAMTDYLEQQIRATVLLGTTYTAPATVYFALFTDATADDGSGTEASGGSYARQALSMAAGTATDGVVETDAAVEFTNMPAGTFTHAAIYDASSGGNMLLHGPLSSSVTTSEGNTIRFPAGDITATFA